MQDADDELRSHGLTVTMLPASYVSVRTTYFNLHPTKKLRPQRTPAKCYLESRLEELEQGEIRVEQLSEVVSQFEQAVGDPGRMLDVTLSGAWATRRSKVRGVAPRGTEELCTRYKLMSVHW